MGKEEERLGYGRHRGASRERDVDAPGEAQRVQLQQSGYITSTTPTSRGGRERATTGGHCQVVLSLLCLWPYGNSLIASSHSEFYQCHTQNRSHYRATSQAGQSARERRWRRPSGATQTRLPTLVRRVKTKSFRQERHTGRNTPEKWEERRSFRLQVLSNGVKRKGN